jgi:hypothetical protein
MNKPQIIECVTLIAHHQPSEIAEPGEAPLIAEARAASMQTSARKSRQAVLQALQTIFTGRPVVPALG